MASMGRADSQPPCSADTYPQVRHDLHPIPNDNGLSLSGNGSSTVAAVAADMKIIEMQRLESLLSVSSSAKLQ